MRTITNILRTPDWWLFGGALLLSLFGLVTMSSFVAEDNYFSRQLVWIILATCVYVGASLVDWRFLRSTKVSVAIFIVMAILLGLVATIGTISQGAQSWFNLGFFNFQPADPAKIALVIILAKYFTRRHAEIGHVRHILVSGFYTFIFFLLIFIQPDFGSAIIIGFIWFVMILVSGISKRHLAFVIGTGVIAFGALWLFVFQPYQKARIVSFIHPLADIRGSGYNAYQSTVAVGSGELFGKGIGFGTQSKLKFLPEYQTDFIFAAFSEEWGFVGGIIILVIFSFLVARIMYHASRAPSNFETLFCVGFAGVIVAHSIVHIGMNIGLLPVTGVPLPYMSYGGSHLLTEFLALGIISSFSRFSVKSRVATMEVDLL
ncbi:MAG: rod shape-determining protein RodA [Candidatus Zambryskibacteria bacterium CG10_big_fil_rev_8_21_14_0_10_42_12]|uniref:Rod shape-determining protein RodA n=1 Tax=Candidatus Zambryskibacteria bacterium CG10_big_fil_rev_8_21_14_0_10_42_12 TaxID=1975115 RepID=A0A2H0QTV3_9BACT|nr:MAG: rod shape-determining protein RodA [Candidatus Zambryskibacteria bacterium CG10_big_fil_rev_8_21_14_0_10_42_12]